jgi:hypothetical protein
MNKRKVAKSIKRIYKEIEQNCFIDTAFKIVPFLSSDNSDMAPPDPIPNSEVKRVSADGSVGVPM